MTIMKNSLFIVLFSVLFPGFLWAQDPLTQVSASSEYTDLTSQQIAQMTEDELAANRQVFMVETTVGSSSGLVKIALMVGSSEGSNDIFYREFDYGNEGDFQDGTSYHADGNHITLGTTVHGIHRHYVQVVAIMDDGSQKEPVRTTIN